MHLRLQASELDESATWWALSGFPFWWDQWYSVHRSQGAAFVMNPPTKRATFTYSHGMSPVPQEDLQFTHSSSSDYFVMGTPCHPQTQPGKGLAQLIETWERCQIGEQWPKSLQWHTKEPQVVPKSLSENHWLRSGVKGVATWII